MVSAQLVSVHSFVMPKRIIYGWGALDSSASAVATLGSKSLIITDAMMSKLGNLSRVTSMLEKFGVKYSIYDGIVSEPIDTMIDKGVNRFINEGCDFMIALGGGSSIDAMKAIAICAASGRDITEYENSSYSGKTCPMVAIPTTAGTGSEATQFTIITDTKRDVKMLIGGASLIPELAIVDPALTLTVPANVTAATGVDALCHAIEAYISRKSQPLSKMFSLSACKRIFAYLERCVASPECVEARAQMSLAAIEAGVAFNNASVTLIHGMSRPIGALFHIPHGVSNAMIMEECLRFAMDGAVVEFAEIAHECGLSREQDNYRAAEQFLSAIHGLLARISIPGLEQLGIEASVFKEAIPKMVADAEASGSPANTLRIVTRQDMSRIYQRICS